VKYGVVGSFGSAERIVEMGVAAEEAGWDGFFSWDGISVGPVDTFDPWVLLGAIATRTSRITLGAMVFAVPRQQPWKLARESITVDQLSDGRLVMPVGLGASPDDAGFSRVSGGVTDRRTRAELLDDSLAILDRAWTGETFSYQGTHHFVRDIVFQPKPIAQPRIPIWVVAAYGYPKSMSRAVRWDGVILGKPLNAPPFTPTEIRDAVAWIGEHRESDAPFEVIVEGVLPAGAEGADRAAGLAEAGATWWIESHWDGPTSEPDNLLALIRSGPRG